MPPSGDARQRYESAMHAMQSAVAMQLAAKTGLPDGHPILKALKDVRVGVNSALTDQGSLARLLIEKGLFTEAEYVSAIADGAEREAERAARETRAVLGLPDTVSFG